MNTINADKKTLACRSVLQYGKHYCADSAGTCVSRTHFYDLGRLAARAALSTAGKRNFIDSYMYL